MNTAHQIINEIISTGSKFTLYGGEVGLTQVVSNDLLERARKHKTQIRKILENIKQEGRQVRPKVWLLKIKSSENETIDTMTMIDPARMTHDECQLTITSQFGIGRVISITEKIAD